MCHQGTEKRRRVSLADFEAFGYLIKHSFESFIQLLKLIVKYGEKQGNKIAKIYANQDGISKPLSRLRFSLFKLLDELLTSLRKILF